MPSVHDAVIRRLHGWRSEPGRSILHSLFDDCDTRERLRIRRMQAQKGSLPFVMSSKGKKGEYMALGTPSGITKEHLNKHFRDDSQWWSTITIQSILEVVNQIVRSETDGAVFRPSQPMVWQNDFCLRNLSGVFSSRPSSLANIANNQCPLPSLGRDASWRKQNTISVVTPDQSNHFLTIAILGRLRLVVVYDGLGGSCDPSLIWTVRLLCIFLSDTKLTDRSGTKRELRCKVAVGDFAWFSSARRVPGVDSCTKRSGELDCVHSQPAGLTSMIDHAFAAGMGCPG